MEHIPALQRHSIRLRQLLAVRETHLKVLYCGEDQDFTTDLNTLAHSLRRLTTAQTKWDKQLVTDLHTLHAIGVTSIEDMLTVDKTHVTPSGSLINFASKRNIRSKHRTAWNRVAYFLTSGTPWQGDNMNQIPRKDRKQQLHSQIVETLESHRCPTKHKSVLQILADMPAYTTMTVQQARDVSLTHWEQMQAQNPRSRSADIRTQQAGTMHLKNTRSRLTGYAQYLEANSKLINPRNPSKDARFIKKMLDYIQCTHTWMM